MAMAELIDATNRPGAHTRGSPPTFLGFSGPTTPHEKMLRESVTPSGARAIKPLMTSSLSLPAPAVSSDASLLAAARHDPDAFRELYERYAEAVLGYFVRRTGSRTTALDLTAETFAQAWFVRAGFRDEAEGSAGPWVYGIARNVLLMSVRRGAIERRATERLGLQERLERPQCVDDPVPESTWADGADELLDTLPAHQREAVRLRVLEDLEYSDVARALGTTPAAARVRVHRGLKALKQHLSPSKENHS
jgi:RNA polymerase sigma factor (sigma-70 family)